MTKRLNFLLLFLFLTSGVAVWAQEPFQPPEGVPPESDFVYRKHYEEVQQIMALPDLAERERRLTAYYQKVHPKAKIRQYMEAFFLQIVKAYQQAGREAEAKALMERIAKMFPQSASLIPQQFQAAFNNKDYAKAIELGNKLLANNPNDPQLLYMLTQSYLATNNTAKVAELAPRLVNALGPQKSIYYVVWLGDYYASQGDTAKSAQYYEMALNAYPTGVPEGWEARRWERVKSIGYGLRALRAYSNKDFKAAVANYKEALKYDRTNANNYLYLGLSHWRMQELDEAQSALAKAVVLGGNTQGKAREYLEQIYKARNNNSLEGLEEVLAKAKAELNL